MIAADQPIQRAAAARLLVIDSSGAMHRAPRRELARFLAPGDLLVANDAATLPASLAGHHHPTGRAIEARLAGRSSLAFEDIHEVTAVVFGEGDHRTPTEDRPAPPPLQIGDDLALGPLRATVTATLGHPRLVGLRFAGTPSEIWSGIAHHGRPVQYAHIEEPLALWDVWTRVAAVPAAFEPPSAGFLLDWRLIADLRRQGVAFATLTHAAGLSSTGDSELDRRLPLDEPYRIPATTVQAITRTRARGGRVIALGTTVIRALEHSSRDGVPTQGDGLANQRIGPSSSLQVVDALISGAHEPGESHYELLRSLLDDDQLAAMSAALEGEAYRNHEFGDSVLIERPRPAALALAG
ncbi:MAG: S-adenosylmethionine:tRNA ribosyltransferase-isomerase [Acidobacteriota bacterium]